MAIDVKKFNVHACNSIIDLSQYWISYGYKYKYKPSYNNEWWHVYVDTQL